MTTSPDPALTESTPTDMAKTKRKDDKVNWGEEIKGAALLLAAVLGFHSFIAKPFYIPSESMVPTLMVGDRLVVNKFAYGWSHVSPTIPSIPALFRWLVLREPVESLAVNLPDWKGRIWGSDPERGDVVILTPPGMNQDYIKRVIGLPGDRIEMRGGLAQPECDGFLKIGRRREGQELVRLRKRLRQRRRCAGEAYLPPRHLENLARRADLDRSIAHAGCR